MPTIFGVGFSELTDSFQAGKKAAEQALSSQSLNPSEVKLCLLFCTSRHEPAAFSNGIRSVVGETCAFVGGYANGTMSNNHFGYDGYQTVVGLLASDTVHIDIFAQEGIAFNEYETGKALAQQIQDTSYSSPPYLLLFFDAVNRLKGRFIMNYGEPFIRGMYEVWEKWHFIAGVRMMGDMKFKPTYQWFDQKLLQNSALAVALSGNIEVDHQIMHGCTPASAYHTVTKADGATILEIDGQSAISFAQDIFGEVVANDLSKLKFFLTLGKNLGDKWADFEATNYVNRMCVGIDERRGGLRMGEMDMVEGTEFQLMRRGFEMEYLVEQAEQLVQKVKDKNRRLIFGLYFNCAGRAAAYSGNVDEDVRYIQKALKDEMPLLGIYGGGELAMVAGELQVLDWTGILCLFSEPK